MALMRKVLDLPGFIAASKRFRAEMSVDFGGQVYFSMNGDTAKKNTDTPHGVEMDTQAFKNEWLPRLEKLSMFKFPDAVWQISKRGIPGATNVIAAASASDAIRINQIMWGNPGSEKHRGDDSRYY